MKSCVYWEFVDDGVDFVGLGRVVWRRVGCGEVFEVFGVVWGVGVVLLWLGGGVYGVVGFLRLWVVCWCFWVVLLWSLVW